jgi:hypothetical protein
MKPLPAQKASAGSVSSEVMPSLPALLAHPAASYSSANRRASTCVVQRVYPWLLTASTAVAAVFCLFYITKPVITPAATSHSIPAPHESMAAAIISPTATPGLMPGKSLPGDKSASTSIKPAPADPRNVPSSASSSPFEETNIRIQHVLTAEAPGGHVDRIDLDVPVLYQSRNLRWTPDEIASARQLLVRLMDHQEKSRQLRSEGVALLDSWNHLVGKSIPASELRADSPTLPANQLDGADDPQPAGLITNESIQLQPSSK